MATDSTKMSSTAKDGKSGEDTKAQEGRIRAVAMQHALSIQEKKNLQNKVLDMILKAYDLPIDNDTNSARPTQADADAFRACLSIFRPEDLDELVQERNIDDRCGYAMCSNSAQTRRTTKVWDNKLSTFVDKQIGGNWCSEECKSRNDFVRRQLGNEPVWLRQEQNQHIRLSSDDEKSQSVLVAQEQYEKAKDAARQDALAVERGDTILRDPGDISIREKESTAEPKPPRFVPEITVGDVLEGMPIRSRGNRRT